MLYVFDTNCFIVLGHYFPERFPSFWNNINTFIKNGSIISTREVFNELIEKGNKEFLDEWIKTNKHIFQIPTSEELQFVKEIFSIPHFQQLVKEKQRLKGTPVADPFVIALAKVHNACVVTEESNKKNAARIPNVCDHFEIDCTNLEGFMKRENWTF